MFFAEPPPTSYDLHFPVARIPVRVHPLFWLATLLLGASAAVGDDALIQLLIWTAVVFVSILIHELGHSLTMAHFGESSHIVLYMLGGLAIPDSARFEAFGRRRARTTSSQVMISLAGPCAGFLFAAVTILAFYLVGGRVIWDFSSFHFWWLEVPAGTSEYFAALVDDLLYVNIFWGLVNLLPVFPLDGGQVARALLCHRDPWGGMARSLWLSVLLGGGMAVVGIVYLESLLTAMLFGSLAASSYMALQQMGGGGGYGGVR